MSEIYSNNMNPVELQKSQEGANRLNQMFMERGLKCRIEIEPVVVTKTIQVIEYNYKFVSNMESYKEYIEVLKQDLINQGYKIPEECK